jgi:hypothetical protein
VFFVSNYITSICYRYIPGFERYYSKGVTDDDYCVNRFTAEKGRYFPGSSETFDIEELTKEK